MQDTEKAKVLQSIASVIQALPPAEEIPPVEVRPPDTPLATHVLTSTQAIVSPVVAKLFEALQSAGRLPEEARAMAVQQLETLTGVARGLTRVSDSLLALDDSPDVQAAMNTMDAARADARVVKLRDALLSGIRSTVELWSTDAMVSDVRWSSYCERERGANSRVAMKALITPHTGAQRLVQGDYGSPFGRDAHLASCPTAAGTRVLGRTEAAHSGVAVANNDAHHPTQSTRARPGDVQARA